MAENPKPIERDTERFRFQFTNEIARLPEGFRAPMCMLTTRQLIARRLEELELSTTLRVPQSTEH